MLLKTIFVKIVAPVTLAGGAVGSGGYVVTNAVFPELIKGKEEHHDVDGWEVTFQVSGQQGQSKLVCPNSSLDSLNAQKHNLRLKKTGDESAELTCFVGNSEQSGSLKVTKEKAGDKEKPETQKEFEGVESGSDGIIADLECNAYDAYPQKLFTCSCKSQKIKVEAQQVNKLLFTVEKVHEA